MSPEVKIGLLIGSLALLLTVHVIVVFGLFARPAIVGSGPHTSRSASFGEAILGLVLPPLAPVFAWRRGTRIRAVLWGLFALLYVGTFVVAR